MAGEAYKGKIVKGSTTVLGMATWTYAGEEQRLAEYSEFQNPHAMQAAVLKSGGDITISGRFIQDDPGVALLQTAFDNQEQITDLRLYKNASNYLMSDPAVAKEDGTTFASHCLMTKSPRAFNFDSAGLGQIEITLRVVGVLKEY
jgi:hypothetical protein